MFRPRYLRSMSAWCRRKSVRTAVTRSIATIIIVTGAAFVLLPLLWMISTSLKNEAEVFIVPIRWIPKKIMWGNYPTALTKIRYFTYVRNTLTITVGSTLGAGLSASLVAFGFARLRAKAKDVLFIILLSTMMLPYQVTLVPTYLMFLRLGWVNTYLPLVVPSWFGGGAFFIFLMRQFYATLPTELDDAAKIDGCSVFGIYWRIILPLSKPALATLAIFSFFGNWNDFMGPLIYLSKPETYTIALGLDFYRGAFGSVTWGLLMAATMVSILPPMLVFLFLQNYFVQGIALTGLKG